MRRGVLVAFLRLVRIEYGLYGEVGVVMAAGGVAEDLIPLQFELCFASIVVFPTGMTASS